MLRSCPTSDEAEQKMSLVNLFSSVCYVEMLKTHQSPHLNSTFWVSTSVHEIATFGIFIVVSRPTFSFALVFYLTQWLILLFFYFILGIYLLLKPCKVRTKPFNCATRSASAVCDSEVESVSIANKWMNQPVRVVMKAEMPLTTTVVLTSPF